MKLQNLKRNTLLTQGMFFLTGTLLLLSLALPVAAEVVVVVAADSTVNKISKGDIRRIFLVKSINLPNGQVAHPVNQDDSTSVYTSFISTVLNKTEVQLHSYWSRLVFTGKGQPLISLANDTRVKEYVSSTEGGVGYIDSQSVDNTVKVVFPAP